MAKWMLKQTKVDFNKLDQDTKIDSNVAYILASRGIKTSDEIRKFINGSVSDFYDPKLMKDLEKGVRIILDNIEQKKRLVVFGDYDVDGVMSTLILYKALRKLNSEAIYYIPHREDEGYGMTNEAIEELHGLGVDVILTCDNGISAINQIELAKNLGMTVVVIDHHEVSFEYDKNGERVPVVPAADAIINPKQQECDYPFKVLCAAGIAYMFAQQLYKSMNINETETKEFLGYAAIATICDVVDLVDQNRIIVKSGLELINNTNSPGLKALVKTTGLEGKLLEAYHIGFIIGPCINASGRLEMAALAVELFLEKDEERANQIAAKLVSLNNVRKQMTVQGVEKIRDLIECSNVRNDKVLVVYEQDVHESIAGIIAGRIKETYYLPTIVLTKGKENTKGSGRSIDNYNLFEELLKCKDLLLKFGGHPMAAGLTIDEENIELLRRRLNENCALTDDEIIPVLKIDKHLKLENINFQLVKNLKILEPYGKGNPTPLFGDKNIQITKVSVLGKEQNVLKMLCKSGTSGNIEGISFGGVEKFKQMVEAKYGTLVFNKLLDGLKCDVRIDMVFSLGINDYRGRQTLQMQVKDFRLSDTEGNLILNQDKYLA